MENRLLKSFSGDHGFFTLFHVCETVSRVENVQLQLLSRILYSQLNDLRGIIEKIRSLEDDVSDLEGGDNPYLSRTESVIRDKRKSSMNKKKNFMLKHKRSTEIQIFDTVKSVYRTLEADSGSQNSETSKMVHKKLQDLEKYIF